jgi:hypothetical protein
VDSLVSRDPDLVLLASGNKGVKPARRLATGGATGSAAKRKASQ